MTEKSKFLLLKKLFVKSITKQHVKIKIINILCLIIKDAKR
jgi:hypothetical protein